MDGGQAGEGKGKCGQSVSRGRRGGRRLNVSKDLALEEVRGDERNEELCPGAGSGELWGAVGGAV